MNMGRSGGPAKVRFVTRGKWSEVTVVPTWLHVFIYGLNRSVMIMWSMIEHPLCQKRVGLLWIIWVLFFSFSHRTMILQSPLTLIWRPVRVVFLSVITRYVGYLLFFIRNMFFVAMLFSRSSVFNSSGWGLLSSANTTKACVLSCFVV
jgi:hypothetical protein